MTTFLVTGCAGFIGTTFVHYMLNKYDSIRIINLDVLTYAGNLENLRSLEVDDRHIFVQGDICNKELVTQLIAEYDPDYIINFAAESHVDRSIANPEIFVTTNVMGTVNLLQCAKEAWYDPSKKTWKKGKKYVQVSTDEVYGALGPDGFFTETTPINPHSPYSSSKASADMFVKAFYDTYGMPINITRCSNNYGPYQFPEKLIPLMINNVKHHKQLPVYGDGMQIRDWLYVEDHCKAIDMVASGGKIGEVYNIGGHNERTNIFIVKTIIEQLHDRLKDDEINESLINHVEDRLGHAVALELLDELTRRGRDVRVHDGSIADQGLGQGFHFLVLQALEDVGEEGVLDNAQDNAFVEALTTELARLSSIQPGNIGNVEIRILLKLR